MVANDRYSFHSTLIEEVFPMVNLNASWQSIETNLAQALANLDKGNTAEAQGSARFDSGTRPADIRSNENPFGKEAMNAALDRNSHGIGEGLEHYQEKVAAAKQALEDMWSSIFR
jgi:histidinol-phosphate/aromatic aminotransferase/cobyric acid decarboxylase-like protein